MHLMSMLQLCFRKAKGFSVCRQFYRMEFLSVNLLSEAGKINFDIFFRSTIFRSDWFFIVITISSIASIFTKLVCFLAGKGTRMN